MIDTWWAFVAGIDHADLLRELPGSATDRRLRELHIERRKRFFARMSGNIAELVVEAETLGRASKRSHPKKPDPVTELDKTLAAYAARKRKKAA